MLRLGRRRASTRASVYDSVCNLLQVSGGQLEIGSANPAIHLLRRTRTNDCSCDARPCDHPRYGDCGYRRAVALRDGAQGVSQRKIAAQFGLLEIGRAVPPIIFGKLRNTFLGEAVG